VVDSRDVWGTGAATFIAAWLATLAAGMVCKELQLTLLACVLGLWFMVRRSAMHSKADEVAKAFVDDGTITGAVVGSEYEKSTAGVDVVGWAALRGKAIAPFHVRLWRLLSNPFLYLATGRIRW